MAEKKRKYITLSLSQREEIIKIFNLDEEKGLKSNCSEIAKQFNVSDITIRRMRDSQSFWKEQFEKCEEMPSRKRRKRLRVTARNVLLENILYDWIQEKKIAGQPVSGPILKEKALSINVKIDGDPNFRASDGWLCRFKQRYQISSFSLQGEKVSVDSESRMEFVDELASIIRLRNFQLYEVYNAYETGLQWKMLPLMKFVDEYEKGASGFTFSEERVTVMVCANADGSQKIPLFVIGKSMNPECFENLKQLPVDYAGQKNAWMTRELFKKWFMDIFMPSVRSFQAKRQRNYQVLLILDNAKCHLSKGELESIDDICSVEFLPPNVTSSIQPMGQGVIEKLKKLYRKSFLREMLLEENEQSLLDFVKGRNMKTCCTRIASAWSQINETDIRQSWRKLIPGSDLEITTSINDVTVDEFLHLFHRIPGFEKITPAEVTTWLEADANEPGWESPSIEQILHRQGYQIKVENSEEPDPLGNEEGKIKEEPIGDGEPVTPDSVSMIDEAADAYNGLKTFRNWFEKRLECNPEHLIQLQQFNEFTVDIVSQLNSLKVSADSMSVSD